MIKIDIVAAMAVFLFFLLLVVFIFWIFYNYRGRGTANEMAHFRQCPYCTYIFFSYAKDTSELLICPRCKSYMEGQ